jgi:hypothetical protein
MQFHQGSGPPCERMGGHGWAGTGMPAGKVTGAPAATSQAVTGPPALKLQAARKIDASIPLETYACTMYLWLQAT